MRRRATAHDCAHLTSQEVDARDFAIRQQINRTLQLGSVRIPHQSSGLTQVMTGFHSVHPSARSVENLQAMVIAVRHHHACAQFKLLAGPGDRRKLKARFEANSQAALDVSFYGLQSLLLAVNVGEKCVYAAGF